MRNVIFVEKIVDLKRCRLLQSTQDLQDAGKILQRLQPLPSLDESVDYFLCQGCKIREGQAKLLGWNIDHFQLAACAHADHCSHPGEHRNVADKMTLAEDHEIALFSSPGEVHLCFAAYNKEDAEIPVTGAEEMLAIRNYSFSPETCQRRHFFRVESLQSEKLIVTFPHPIGEEVGRWSHFFKCTVLT